MEKRLCYTGVKLSSQARFGSLFGGVSRLRRAKRKAPAFHHARQESYF